MHMKKREVTVVHITLQEYEVKGKTNDMHLKKSFFRVTLLIILNTHIPQLCET